MKRLLAAMLILAAPAFGQDVTAIAAQPDRAQLEAWKADGVTTIINMRPDAEMADVDYDEKAAALALGMDYVSVPFDRANVSPEITRALGAALDAADGRVALHCASGSRAANALAALRIERGEADPAMIESPAPGTALLPSLLRSLSPRYAAMRSGQ